MPKALKWNILCRSLYLNFLSRYSKTLKSVVWFNVHKTLCHVPKPGGAGLTQDNYKKKLWIVHVSHLWFAWQTAQQIQPWYIKKIWADWISGKSKMTSKLLIISRIRYNRDVCIFLICFWGYSWCAYKNYFRHSN